MAFRVHNALGGGLTEEALRYLTDNGCRLSEAKWKGLPEEEVCREIRGLDAVIAGNEPYTRRVFEAADKLKILARCGVGFDAVDLAAAAEHGIWVTNTPGANAAAVADFTVGLILCLVRNIHRMARDVKEGKWGGFGGRELSSLTLGVIGTGAIGQQVIRRMKAFETNILAYDIRPNSELSAESQVEYVPLDDLVARSDIITIHVPLNEDTRGLINESRLKLMKQTAYLVDTSRPGVVDKTALAKALQAKEIAGAALDVHDPIPLAQDDPFLRLDNALVTPWVAGGTEESGSRMSMTAVRNVVAVLQGRGPLNPLNDVREPRSASA